MEIVEVETKFDLSKETRKEALKEHNELVNYRLNHISEGCDLKVKFQVNTELDWINDRKGIYRTFLHIYRD